MARVIEERVKPEMEVSKYVDMMEYPFEELNASDPALPIVLDTETLGYTAESRFVIYFSWSDPYNQRIGTGAGPTTTEKGFKFFEAILHSPRPKIFHAVTRDLEFIERSGMVYRGARPYCTLLGHALLDEYHPTHALDDLTRDIFGKRRSDYYDLLAYQKKVSSPLKNAYIPQRVMHTYACEDAGDTGRLWLWEESRLKEQGLWPIYEIGLDAEIYGWYQMEKDGIEFDSEAAQGCLDRIEPSIDIVEEFLYDIFGERFNLLSPKQLGTVLKKHFPLTKKTKTGWATDIDTLRKFRHDPRIQTLIAGLKLRRAASKVRNRVAEGSNRLYPQFSQVLVTGRSACSGVPLHQIPKRAGRIDIEDVGTEALVDIVSGAYQDLRRMWIPASGATLVTFDYDQAEYRAAAHYSGSDRLIALMQDPKADFHAVVCQLVFNTVTKVLRDIVKHVNFGLLYGMAEAGIARTIEKLSGKAMATLTTETTSSILRKYEAQVPEMRQLQKDVMASCATYGYVRDVFGRRYRRLPEWFKKAHDTGDYAIINYLCQGTVGNIKRLAIARLGKELFAPMQAEGRRSKMVVEIHDELGFEIYPEDAHIIHDIHRIMTDLPMFKLPFTTAPSCGSNLLEVKDYSLDEAVDVVSRGVYVRAAA